MFALLLTLLAGLSTGLGGALVLVVRRDTRSLLAGSLGFSAGVMVWVSFRDLYPEAVSLLARAGRSELTAVVALLGGMLAAAAIDFLVPERANPHLVAESAGEEAPPDRSRMRRVGVLVAAAIALHNLPEGVATLFSALHDPALGTSVAVAVALHNLPEGIAVAVPIYEATGSRWRGIRAALMSGLAEPVGAGLGYMLLRPVLTDAVLGTTYAAVAGVMVFISLDQLLPNAKHYEAGHASVYGLIGGMAVMALAGLAW